MTPTDYIVSITLLVPEAQVEQVRDLFLDKLRKICPRLQARASAVDEGLKLICRQTSSTPESAVAKVLYWCEKASRLEARLSWAPPTQENIVVEEAGELDDLVVDERPEPPDRLRFENEELNANG